MPLHLDFPIGIQPCEIDGRAVFPVLEKMFGVRFLIPENAEYRTAVGAALAFILGHPVRDVPQGKEQSV